MNFHLLRMLLTASIVLLAAATHAAKPIESQMTEAELQESGLLKLSENELKFLNNWLTQNKKPKPSVASAETPPASGDPREDPRIAYEEAKKALVADRTLTIDGAFIGWSGDTIFRMTNGEVWKQRTKGFYRKRLISPEVEIYTNRLGFYMMRVKETGKKIGVKRVDK